MQPVAGQINVKPGRNAAEEANPALTALMDHFAAELAREYIHLMESAVKARSIPSNAPQNEEE